MSDVLYVYGDVGVISDVFDFDCISAELWHAHLRLTKQSDAWELGEIRVELLPSFVEVNSVVWKDGKGYLNEDISRIIWHVWDVTYRPEGLKAELFGYVYMTDVTKRFGELYKFGGILLQEGLVGEQADSWEEYMQFCEKNSGFLFPERICLTLCKEGVVLK